jgi:FkbM family methyltransferase
MILAVIYLAKRFNNNAKNISYEETKDLGEQICATLQGKKVSRRDKSHVKLYDLKAPNVNNFTCVQSAKIIVSTKICIHDIERDLHISFYIQKNGVWEEHIMDPFMRMLNSKNDINVLDIGGQLGQYTLFAAKLGRKCITIEPFYDSYIRFHKSVKLENLEDNILLLTYGISDKRGELKRLTKDSSGNVGAQTLLNDSNDYSINKTNITLNEKYLIETILLDDITEVLPDDFINCVMKIDIEGYESKAFREASKLFTRLNILAIIIEWSWRNNPLIKDEENVELLNFFITRNYEFRTVKMDLLKMNDWKTWPMDVLVVRKDFKF